MQSRAWLPAPFQAVEWFAPDDSSTSPRTPLYGGATRIPGAFGSRVGQTPGAGVAYAPVADAFHMSLQSAFWVSGPRRVRWPVYDLCGVIKGRARFTPIFDGQIWNLVGNIAWGERYQDIIPSVIAQVNAADARLQDAVLQVCGDRRFGCCRCVDG